MSIDSRLRLPDHPRVVLDGQDDREPLATSLRPVPGRGPVVLHEMAAAADALEEVPGVLGQLGDAQITDLMGLLLRLQARAGQLAALVAADAADRGTVSLSDAANTGQWVTACAKSVGCSVEPREVCAVAAVADACRDRRNHVVCAAIREGSCTLSTARAALRHAGPVAAVLPTASRDEIHAWFLQLDPAQGAHGVTQLTRRLIAIYDPDRLSAHDAKLDEVESLTWQNLPTGMTRLVADLAPADAAVVKHAITTLSAPRPAGLCDAVDAATPRDAAHRDADAADVARSGEFDPSAGNDQPMLDRRTPGKRRADALVELVAAGAKAATAERAQVGSGATLLVTVGLDALRAGIDGPTTPAGEVLDPAAARRLACDADLIPVVLAGPSQPLDVGRRERLVTGGLRAAVLVRDRGCTFPGCDRPPGFCEIHHIVPWTAGGPTSLANSAMLCRRHHQTVHRQGYLAAAAADGVRWDLTPARMPGRTNHVA